MTPAVLAVLVQIAYPLVHGTARQGLSVVVVLLLCAAAVVTCPNRWRLLAVVVPASFAVEVVGVRTGFPFGRYAYTGHLGPRLLEVPLVVPLAWVVIAWCSLCVARRVGRAVPLVGAVAMTSWDAFLDPQMVHAANWAWRPGTPALQGIPLSNYAAWFVASLLLSAALDRVLAPTRSVTPVALWVWTWLGSTVAFVVFLGLPLAGLLGFAAMGVVGVPLLVRPRGRTARRPAREAEPAAGAATPGLCVTADATR